MIYKMIGRAAFLGLLLAVSFRAIGAADSPPAPLTVSPALDAWLSEVPNGAADIPPAQPDAIYNVRTFGATGDGATKDTAAFQKALDTCAVNGGGDVQVPAGTYLIGSIQIGSKTILRLAAGAILQGSPDLADYPVMDIRWEGRWQPGRRALIYSANVDHTGIIGPGRIQYNINGTNGADGLRNPVVLEPISCNDVRWEGFTVAQGGNWATHPTYCTDMVIKGITVTSNRDGIDVDSCKNVRIEECAISTGDDSISLKSGRGMDGARLAKPCENILITSCTLIDRTFACLGIGSETSGGVRNVRIQHCRLSAPSSDDIYIKTRIGRAGDNDNISGDDLDVQAGSFLRINLVKGGNSSTADDPVDGLVGYPGGKNIRFSNIRVACKTLVQATEISALKPLQGLTLDHITGTCTQGMTLANIVNADLHDINVSGYTGALLGIYNVTGTGLDGAATIPAPVDPPPGNAPGSRGARGPAPATSAPAAQ
jgi:polygalacturonase